MKKSRSAYRTISEVEELLNTPAHVLRYWESQFAQISPVKRAGNRRYYRPSDIELIAGIRKLLHDDGMTIRGVKKILREQGVKHVAFLLPSPLDRAEEEAESDARKTQHEGALQALETSGEQHGLRTVSAFGHILHISSRAIEELDPERRQALIRCYNRLDGIRARLATERASLPA